MKTKEKLVRNSLKVNGIFSALCGIDLLIFQKEFGSLMNIENMLVFNILGIGLLIFSGTVLLSAFRKSLRPKEIKMIIYQDWGWVIGSAILLILNPFDISSIGNILIAIVAILVMTFAILQASGLKRL